MNQPFGPILATHNAMLLPRKLEEPSRAVRVLDPELVFGSERFFRFINASPYPIVEIGRIPLGRVA